MEAPYQIPFAKTKMYLLMLAGVGFVMLSLWFIISPEQFDLGSSNLLVRIFGVIGLLFFGSILIMMVRKILSGKLAIEVNDEGIRDESSGVAVGLVRWEDIEGFEPYSFMGNQFVLVNVRNPEYYLGRARGTIAKSAMRQNERMTGTPIQLNCNSVSISADQLLDLLRAELAFYRKLEEGPGTSLAEIIRQRNRCCDKSGG